MHYIEEINGERPEVYRNDGFTIEQLAAFDVIVLSPGPGLPREANGLMDVLAHYADSKVILGVCLGHQAIAEHFGGRLMNLNKVYHGVASPIDVINFDPIHGNLKELEVGRYHSWVVDPSGLPEDIIPTSKDKEGNIMSLIHRSLPIFGIQYHPESVLTPLGKELMKNFFSFIRSNSHSFPVKDK